MSKNAQSTNLNQLENICNAIYQNEQFFEKFAKNYEYQGYLIESNSIEELKKDIGFKNIKILIQENKPILGMLEKFKENEKIKEKIKKNNSKRI